METPHLHAGNRIPLHDDDDDEPGRKQRPPRPSATSSLLVGATTVAGVGLGLVAVTLGAAVLGAIAEAVFIPSLLLKVAGGIAGGGLGLARGLKDSEKR